VSLLRGLERFARMFQRLLGLLVSSEVVFLTVTFRGNSMSVRRQCMKFRGALMVIGWHVSYSTPSPPPTRNVGEYPDGDQFMSIRPVKKIIRSKPTIEGAGVHLRRAFGFGSTSEFDPFLLLDDFRNDVPADYLAGFPWHPHRGIETITYVLAGTVEHGDSLGNRGAIAAGDVQWMTAGSGIIHQEMPKGDPTGSMHGFQLWGNLPSSLKMTPPRYQEVKASDIPEVTDDDGTHVRIVCGSFWGKRGPVDGVAAEPVYLDVSIPPGQTRILPVETTRHAFAYVFAGAGKFCNASGPLAVPTEGVGWMETAPPPTQADNRTLVVFDRGDEVEVHAGEEGIRFLLVSGKPLGEPVAWYGPIVMNTQEQLRQAFDELQQGTFLK
jgi:redox-sensitive bicupin YhaK (pirin superfamily)